MHLPEPIDGETVSISGPEDLGFVLLDRNPSDDEDSAWIIPGKPGLHFRQISALDALLQVEAIQRAVMGVSNYDLSPASELVLIKETGGFILAAFQDIRGEAKMIGFSSGWGGYIAGRPRLCSDMLAVLPEFHSRRIGLNLKRLQAGLALSRGFREIVWTADPLRAANAHLNFHLLGAYADRYERNRYGEAYGKGLYGCLPSDRLHIKWPVSEPYVQRRLLGRVNARLREPLEGSGPNVRLVSVPAAIDDLVQSDFEQAMVHRLRLRNALESAFAKEFRVCDFVRSDVGRAGYFILRKSDSCLQPGEQT